MKNILIIILTSVVIFIGVIYFYKKLNNNITPSINNVGQISNPVKNIILIKDGEYCFSRTQMATDTEPYNVKEDIILNIKGNTVSGTKKGTQSGPDMTNGYFGNLNGSIKGNIMELIYSYSVEGSKARELELYEMKDNLLIKTRWPLVNINNILTPNKTGVPKLIYYTANICKSVTPNLPISIPENPSNSPVACTMDARQCPDGSYVGRTGPNCEFVCPR